MRPIHGSQTNKTTDNMRKENQPTTRELVELIDNNARRNVLREVAFMLTDRADRRNKVLDSETGKDLRGQMLGYRYEEMCELRRTLRTRNIEDYTVAGIIWGMVRAEQ